MNKKILYKLARAGLIPFHPNLFKLKRHAAVSPRRQLVLDSWTFSNYVIDPDTRELSEIYYKEEKIFVAKNEEIKLYQPFTSSPTHSQWGNMIRRHCCVYYPERKSITTQGSVVLATKETKIERLNYYGMF
jgi:hypothetical protein